MQDALALLPPALIQAADARRVEADLNRSCLALVEALVVTLIECVRAGLALQAKLFDCLMRDGFMRPTIDLR